MLGAEEEPNFRVNEHQPGNLGETDESVSKAARQESLDVILCKPMVYRGSAGFIGDGNVVRKSRVNISRVVKEGVTDSQEVCWMEECLWVEKSIICAGPLNFKPERN